MITITSKWTLKDNKKEEFIKIAKELIEESNKECGCISYDLYEDINDDKIVTFIEVWESSSHLDEHGKTEHFTRIVPILRELKIDSCMNIYTKVSE